MNGSRSLRICLMGLLALMTRCFGGLAWGWTTDSPAKVLDAGGSGAGSTFGTALAVDGDWLAVGDNGFDQGRGVVWLFRRHQGGGENWGLVTHLTAPSPQPLDFFGFSLAMAGGWLAVGANGDDQAGENAGRVHLFELGRGGADNWGHAAELSPAGARAADGLGQAVAIRGARLVIGALGRAQLAGAAFVYERNAATGEWTEQAELPAELSPGDRFGAAVDLDGDLVVVGARGQDGFTGAAWLYRQVNGAWQVVKQLRAGDAQSNDQSASTVAISGGLVAMGSRFNNEAGPQAGAVYVFAEDAGGPGQWGEWVKLLPPVPQASGQFGWSVSWAGDQLLVGAPSLSGAGAVWWYRLDPESAADLVLVRRLQPGSAGDGSLRMGGQVRARGHEVFTGATDLVTSRGRVTLHRPPGTTPYSHEILADEPVLYYRFEQAHEFPFVRDVSGQARHAAGQGLIADNYVAAAALGNGLRFPGGTERVELPTLPDLTTCTISLWVKPGIGEAAAVNHHLLAGRPTDSGAVALLLDDHLRLRLEVTGNNPASVVLIDAPGISPGWTQLVVTYDASSRSARAFQNGRLKGEAAFLTALPLRLSRAWLGRHPFAPQAMTGFLDELAVHGRVLAADRIAAQYAAAAGPQMRIAEFTKTGSRNLVGWEGGSAPYLLETSGQLPWGEPVETRVIYFPQAVTTTTGERAFHRVRQQFDP